MEDRDTTRPVQPREPRRGSTVEMVDRIRAEEAKIEKQKEPPRGR
jgi:hypothetical protein